MKRRQVKPWVAFLSGILAFFLTVVLVLGTLATFIHRIVYDDGVYQATEKSVQTRQIKEVQSLVDSLSEQYGFDPEPVRAMITAEAFSQYGQSVRNWARQLFQEEEPELDMPMFFLPDLENLIRTDEGFLETVPSAQQRSVAQNSIAGVIEKKCQQLIFPLRSQLIALSRRFAEEEWDLQIFWNLMRYTQYLLPAGIAILVLLLITVRRDPLRLCGYAGASLATAGILDVIAYILVRMLDLTGKVKQINTDYARIVSTFLKQLGRPYIWLGILAIIVGYALITLLYRRYYRLQGAAVG